ncbi:caspase-8-like [Spea bombifrons]|uniref:caspase-8-like n=1 Tax=Spea bombifrons TaxID=233779 RepID=UPI00234A68E2|nr:caspase-8-like [Spea bombifrons]
MEKAGKISQDNLKNLKRVFETMNRMDLLKYIKKFEEQVQGSQVNNIQYGIQDISFQESTVENSKETKSQEETLEHLETYAMKKKPHGWCVVINNRDFTEARSLCKEIEDRNGTDLDAAEIKNVFESRNYIFKEHKNLTGKRILETMEIYANESHDDKDSFVCFILSHGKLGEIFGTDGELIPIRRLTACFNGQHCKSLVGKPKIFFIQACQGDKLQQLVTYETDSPENTDDTKYDCLPVHADFLTAFATVEDYVSIRHTRSGSIYIQTLCKALNDPELYNTELCYILTNVNKKISEDIFKLRNKNIKQMPSFKSELRKRLILPAPVAATQSSELTS